MIFLTTRFERCRKLINEVWNKYDDILRGYWAQSKFKHKDVKVLITAVKKLLKRLEAIEKDMN